MHPVEIFECVGGVTVWTLLAVIVCLPLLLKTKGVKRWRLRVSNQWRALSFLAHRQRRVRGYPDLKRKDKSLVELGLLPAPWERELDRIPTSWKSECDGIHFVGISADQSLLDVCVNRIGEDLATVWVVLKRPDGQTFTLPSADSRKVYIPNQDTFASSGLHIKCLSPLRKWKISFNGLLKRQSAPNAKDDGLFHTKFSFVWLAMSAAQEQKFSYTARDLADSFARENRNIQLKDLQRLQGVQDRCEQWGQMMGTLTFGGEESSELYFWSLKTRITDSPQWNEDISCSKFYIYFMQEGVPLKLERLSIRGTLSNLTSGYTVSPFGGIESVQKCELDIGDRNRETSLSFTLKGSRKTVRLFPTEATATWCTGPDLQRTVTWTPYRAEMEGCEAGYGVLHRSASSRPRQIEEFQWPPLLLKDPGPSPCKELILPLDDERCCSSELAGGKGSSLALLVRLSRKTDQFIVPKGFVLTTEAFREHLASHREVYDAVQKLNDVSCRKVEGDLKTECGRCTATFASVELGDPLKDVIRGALLYSYGSLEEVRFSVRSSAFGEDSEDLSAAGQMLTILGVKGIQKIYRAIVQCWASKFSFEAVQYARQNGQSLVSPMGVVLQEMVASDFSGVLFTVDPVTGDPTHPYITANYGLGETVVSALADPDTVILKREQDQSLRVFQTNIGTKKTQLFMTGDGMEHQTYEHESPDSCLTPQWSLKIGRAGVLIESCFCSPRDIEWAVHKETLYLLQARPITTLHAATEFELIHDQDTPSRSTMDFWTRANTGEVFLGATSPLGLDIVVGAMDIHNQKTQSLRERKIREYSPYYLHILPATHRQICFNLVDILFRGNQKEITDIQRAFEAALFGRPVLSEEMHQAGIKKYGYMNLTRKYMGLLYVITSTFMLPRVLARVDEQVSKYSVPLEKYTTAKKTWEGILKQLDLNSEVFSVHGMSTFLSSYYNMMLMTILSKQKKEWDTELYCDFATMLSSCSEVESAAVPESLQVIARNIFQRHGRAFASLDGPAAYDLLKKDSGECGQLFEQFLQQHGHRCVKEFDPYTKSWGMQPESLIPTLQNMVGASSGHSNAATRTDLTTEDILAKIKTPLTPFNKRILKFLLPRSRKYVSLREKTKSLLIKMVDWLRKSCYHLGEQMVKEGMLPEAELVFFMTLEEIMDVLDTQKPGIVPKAVRRMRLHPRLNELKLPEIMKGIPKPIQVQPDLSQYAASFTLKGTPVCQGQVKARAVVVLTLNDASQIRSGDILITHATDIGWSPYFPLVSGVVTVLGGLISHGAVIAREFGLPCVVGVENATAAFKSGDIVILDGTKGTVTKVLET